MSLQLLYFHTNIGQGCNFLKVANAVVYFTTDNSGIKAGSVCHCKCSNLLTNIGLKCDFLPVSNALAYCTLDKRFCLPFQVLYLLINIIIGCNSMLMLNALAYFAGYNSRFCLSLYVLHLLTNIRLGVIFCQCQTHQLNFDQSLFHLHTKIRLGCNFLSVPNTQAY